MAALCAVVLLPTSAAPGQWQSGAPVVYLDVIDRYRSGAVEDAVAEILRWPKDRIERSLKDLFSALLTAAAPDPRARVATLDGAVVLHTDAAVRAELAGEARAADVHISAAAAIVDGIEEARRSRAALQIAPRLVSRRDWLLVAAGWQQGRWQLESAGTLFALLLQIAPDDPQVLLAVGMHDEAVHAHETRMMAQYGRLARGPSTSHPLGDRGGT